MSRLVRGDVNIDAPLRFGISPVRVPIASAAPAVEGDATRTDTDNYSTRIVKYIPAEVVAFYLAADKLFVKAPAAAGANVVERFVAELALNPLDATRQTSLPVKPKAPFSGSATAPAA
jgi:hypothetical protein